ncbi:hypothetical protein [Kribbella sp. VKM Ac-2568]|uniref:hypothetical protein n=1 Tax=Kribbella sp. VKM Ac-2568 TaxID=2512219 RepID=UPI001049EBA7|nr:hypothetical protein [Kribbella sp. VKM Ac-2568]TCM45611.1 hypothetical protein EV648_10672 [Kribbella sp. VKM Ac-2568]
MTSIVDMTGNPVDVCELNLVDLAVHQAAADPILLEWCETPIPLHGTPLPPILSDTASAEAHDVHHRDLILTTQTAG